MKKKLHINSKLVAVIFIITGLLNTVRCYAQTTGQIDSLTAFGALSILSAGQDIKGIKLENQSMSLADIKKAFEQLKSGAPAQQVLETSLDAIVSYSRYSTPYLLAAYASFQKNNYLDAHRYLLMYDKIKDRSENYELNKEVPVSFVTQLKTRVAQQYDKLTPAQLSEIYKGERWKQRSLNIGVTGNLRVFGDNYMAGTNNGDINDTDYPINIDASYSEFIWLNKANAFPTSAKNNLGIELKAGFDYQDNLGNSNLPSRNQYYFQPGIFWGKLYIAPFKIFKNTLSTYTDPTTSIDPSEQPNNISILPELRLYAAASQYAANGKGTSSFTNPNIPDGFIWYLFFKTNQEKLAGSNTVTTVTNTTTSTTKTNYSLNTNSYLIGMTVGAKRVEFSVGFGVETFDLYSDKSVAQGSTNTNTVNYNINATPFAGQMSLTFHIL